MGDPVKELLEDENKLRQIGKGIFDGIDTNRSGYLDESELHRVMKQAARTVGAKAPTKTQVQETFKKIDEDSNGKIEFDEFMTVLRMILEGSELDDGSNQEEAKQKAEEEERIQKQVKLFEKYLEDSGVSMAFQLIYAEILSKKIEPNNVFTYTAMRLRQIGKEVAHLLPKNLTANLTES